MAATQKYTYRRLTHDDSIRLLTIVPGSRSEDLLVEIKEKRLQENLVYEAISYVWGIQDFSATIRVSQEGSKFRTSRTIAAALKQLRNPHDARMVWIDAICIDQTKEEEKGHQVQLMSRIYSNATQVLIWLGESSTETPAAFACLAKLADRADALEMQWDPNGFNLNGPQTLAWSSEEAATTSEDGAQGHIFTVLRSPWFHRLWIIQEILLAKEAIVICGTNAISWTRFARAMRLLTAAYTAADAWESISKQDQVNLLKAGNITETRAEFRSWASPNNMVVDPWSHSFILGIYERFRDQLCRDDRDRVYGFLALRGPEHSLKFSPNYTWTIAQTYKEFAISVILAKGGGHILDSAGLWQREVSFPEKNISNPHYLPSWAPELRTRKVTSSLPVNLRAKNFETASKWDGVIDLSRRNENILLFKGDIFDDLLVLIKLGPGLTGSANAVEQLKRSYESLELESYPTGEDGLHALLRTLVMGADDLSIEQLLELWVGYNAVLHADVELKDLDQSVILQFAKLNNRMVDVFALDGLVVTNQGFFGVVPHATNLSDRIAIISGRETPVVVRWVEEHGAYHLIGPCYIHGLMAWDYDNPAGLYLDDWIPMS